jgi:hypothetical protein
VKTSANSRSNHAEIVLPKVKIESKMRRIEKRLTDFPVSLGGLQASFAGAPAES